ncbi:hypothetical protein pb186bvf_003589 [Paramecium bursaria]
MSHVRLPAEVNRILYVRNLPYKITSEEMYDIFGKYGAIRQIRKGVQGDKKGTAFVVYEDIFDAKNAFENLSGFNVANRYLIVLYYQPQKMQERQDQEFQRRQIEKLWEQQQDLNTLYESAIQTMDEEDSNYKTIQAVRKSNYVKIQNMHVRYKGVFISILQKAIQDLEIKFNSILHNVTNERDRLKVVILESNHKIMKLEHELTDLEQTNIMLRSQLQRQNSNQKNLNGKFNFFMDNDSLNTQEQNERLKQQIDQQKQIQEIQYTTQTQQSNKIKQIAVPTQRTAITESTNYSNMYAKDKEIEQLKKRIEQLEKRRIQQLNQQTLMKPQIQYVQTQVVQKPIRNNRLKRFQDILLFQKQQNTSVDHYYEPPKKYKFNLTEDWRKFSTERSSSDISWIKL